MNSWLTFWFFPCRLWGQALKFGLYESLKPTFVQLLSLDDPTEGYLAASVAAGAVASIVLCPMEQTRIKLVTDPTFADGFVSGHQRLTKEEGIASIFFGFPAMLSKQVPYVRIIILSDFPATDPWKSHLNSSLNISRQWQSKFLLTHLLRTSIYT